MMKFLRSQSQFVLVVLAVLCLGFLFYGSGNLLTGSGQRASNDFGRIEGDDVSVAQLYDAVRSTREKLIMNGQQQILQQPDAAKRIAGAAWGQMLLEHEADKLHIAISDQEVVNRIKEYPNFQKNGVFNLDTYKAQMKFMQFMLRIPQDGSVDPTAATQATFEKLIREELRSNAVMGALFGTIRSTAHDVTEEYEKYDGPATVSYVVFDPAALASTVHVTEADIENEYKEHPTNPAYRTKEKRKVDYVLILLSPEQQKLPDDQKTKAKDALGQKALDFALAFQPNPSATSGGSTPPTPDFQAEAKKRGLALGTTDFFTDDSTPAGVPPSPAFNSAAFGLTKDNPISKVVELDNGVAVIHLDEIQPSELQPLEALKPAIEKQLQQSKAVEMAEAKAKLSSAVLKAAVAKGTDFKTAAAALKLNVVTAPSFVPTKVPATDSKLQAVAYASVSLKPGEVSVPVPIQSDENFIVAHLDSRAPADPAGLTTFETQFRQERDQQLRDAAYSDWVVWMGKQPGTHAPPDLDAYGSAD
jgi:peptidyl-prolyl cis-trans isomerase D